MTNRVTKEPTPTMAECLPNCGHDERLSVSPESDAAMWVKNIRNDTLDEVEREVAGWMSDRAAPVRNIINQLRNGGPR